MARLTIVVELNNLDELGVALDDAEHTAGAVLDGDVSHQLVAAEWGETLRGNAFQVGDGNTQVNNFADVLRRRQDRLAGGGHA